jgi:hypothetical protein
MTDAADILGSDPRPAFFPVGNPMAAGLEPPPDRYGQSVRTWVRALAGMQKEALVVNGMTGRAWRLVSDEGPYLSGHDRAPCPLCTFVTGMVSSYTNEISALAASRDIGIRDIRLTLDLFYSMEGSALKGTMVGGAASPELVVEILADAESDTIEELVSDAVTASPATGLLRGILESRFNLSFNGAQIEVGSVAPLGSPLEADPKHRFDEVLVGDVGTAGDLMVKLQPADEIEGAPGGVASSLQDSQSRKLHVRAVCTIRDDGVKEIVENLYSPIGSQFRFLSDEAPELGGSGLAPDAATYLSAGVGFCFMTQVGRYAAITRRQVDGYRIVQDTYLSAGGAGGGGQPAMADPVETHVYLDTSEDEEFARTALDMGEQTCFLHATCRTDLDVVTRVAGMDGAA